MMVVSTGTKGYRNRGGKFPPERATDLKNKPFMVSLYPVAATIALAQTVRAGMLTYLPTTWSMCSGPHNNQKTHLLNRKVGTFLIMRFL